MFKLCEVIVIGVEVCKKSFLFLSMIICVECLVIKFGLWILIKMFNFCFFILFLIVLKKRVWFFKFNVFVGLFSNNKGVFCNKFLVKSIICF